MATLRRNTASPTSQDLDGENGHSQPDVIDASAEPRSEKTLEGGSALPNNGHPEHHRLHPIKMTKILWKSTSKLSSMANFLAPAIPIAIALHFVGQYKEEYKWHAAIFTMNYIAMVPAANWLAFSAAELALKLPKTIGATLEVFAGAIVEIILCLNLLFHDQYEVVKAALLGSMLANLLLVSGSCFIAGGIRSHHSEVSEFVTEVSGAALLVSAVAVILPSQYFQSTGPVLGRTDTAININWISRIVSIALIVAYLALHFFQLKTHHTIYDATLEAAEERDKDRHKDSRRKKLSLVEAVLLLVVALTCVTLHAIFLVNEIEHIVDRGRISDPFMGLILVPLVEKAAEHLTAIDEAWDGAMDLALSHALGATIQTALFVAPLVVIVGWIADRPMNLQFEYFMAFSLLLAVLVVGNFVRDGKTNWLEGLLLLLIYFIIAVAAWYSPTIHPSVNDGISPSAYLPADAGQLLAGHGEGAAEGHGSSAEGGHATAAAEGGHSTGTATREEIIATATHEAAKLMKRMVFG